MNSSLPHLDKPFHTHLGDAEFHLKNAERALERANDLAPTQDMVDWTQRAAAASRKLRRMAKHHKQHGVSRQAPR